MYYFGILDVAVGVARQHLERLDQFRDALLQAAAGLETGGLDLGIGDDIIALVGVLPQGRLRILEVGDLPADLLA